MSNRIDSIVKLQCVLLASRVRYRWTFNASEGLRASSRYYSGAWTDSPVAAVRDLLFGDSHSTLPSGIYRELYRDFVSQEVQGILNRWENGMITIKERDWIRAELCD